MDDVPAVPKRLLRTVGAAARDHRRLAFEYTAEDGLSDTRQVEPYRSLVHAGRLYLLAWDLRRDDWRTFRLDRMADVEAAGPAFVPREVPPSTPTAPDRSDGASQHAVLRFAAPMTTVADRLLSQEGWFEEVGDDETRAALWVRSYEWLAAVVLSMGIDFRIEEPEDFRAHCRILRDRLDRAADPPQR